MADVKKTKDDFSSIVCQPDELTVQIAGHLDLADKIKLSSTCWRLRLVVGTEFFRVTKFTNTEKDGKMMCGLASSKAKILVKQLHFEGRAPTNKSSEYAKISHMMPCSVHSILSNLSQFPKLEKVTISFDFKLDKDEWSCKLCELFPKISIEDALAGESSVAWKALMAMTFNALIPNREASNSSSSSSSSSNNNNGSTNGNGSNNTTTTSSSGIKNLEILDLPPLLISPYWNPNWRDLLSKVEHLRLSVWGSDCGHDKKVLASPGYRLFFKHLDWAILSRLTNLTELELAPSVAGMVVGDSMACVLWPDICFPLEAGHMRKLKSVTFENTFLTTELIDFLVSHSSTLETVKMVGCYAYEEHPESNVHRVGPSWSKMFVDITESRMPRLRKFEVILSEQPNLHLPPPPPPSSAESADGNASTDNTTTNTTGQAAAGNDANATNNNNNNNDNAAPANPPATANANSPPPPPPPPPPTAAANATPATPATTTSSTTEDTDDEETKETKRIHRELSGLLASQPGTRCFAYGHLSNNAELVQGWDFVLKHYTEGDDLDAYNGLCGLMSANAMETPTRVQRLAARYKSSMAFIHARPANVSPAPPERYL